MLNIAIGFDPAEAVTYHIACQSIMDTCSKHVSFIPVNLKNIPEFKRPRDPKQSTEFSFSRFLVPYLCGYSGLTLFMDSDVVITHDISELFDSIDITKAVSVVQHDYSPKQKTKFLGNVQTVYEKKNWSSVMMFNCAHYDCRRLTKEYVETASGLELHQFKWTDKIGSIDPAWNYLVGEGQEVDSPKLIHYTNGSPCFNEYRTCDYASEWFKAKARALHCSQENKVMETSFDHLKEQIV